MDTVERLMTRVELAPSGCWEWTGYCFASGYGKVSFNTPYGRLAHRVLYTLLVEEVPPGLCLDHLCRNRACVNPYHLEVVTGRENTLRGISFSAVNAAKTHCIHGHEFTDENTYVKTDGGRQCRTCQLAQVRRYEARKREAA